MTVKLHKFDIQTTNFYLVSKIRFFIFTDFDAWRNVIALKGRKFLPLFPHFRRLHHFHLRLFCIPFYRVNLQIIDMHESPHRWVVRNNFPRVCVYRILISWISPDALQFTSPVAFPNAEIYIWRLRSAVVLSFAITLNSVRLCTNALRGIWCPNGSSSCLQTMYEWSKAWTSACTSDSITSHDTLWYLLGS